MSALEIQFRHGAVWLPRLGLWLDPHESQTGPERVFVSHAHSDHTGAHREVILSEPTSRLMRARVGGERIEHVLRFGEPRDFATPETAWRVTLLPAGHILGSAMSLIEAGGQRLLYTGDFKLRPGLSAERCDPSLAHGCDVLVMETTYGRPHYRFPPTGEVIAGVVRFCREALDNDETPVLLGYSLGKSQELLRALTDARLPIQLHNQVARLTRVYEELGQCFPPYKTFDTASAAGHVVICPPGTLTPALRRQLGRIRAATLTGWAVDPGCRFRSGVDAAFPLSDHADFSDLIEFVRIVAPRRVLTLHGFAADFARTLREMDYDAAALSEVEQLELRLASGVGNPLATGWREAPPSPEACPLSAALPTESRVQNRGSGLPTGLRADENADGPPALPDSRFVAAMGSASEPLASPIAVAPDHFARFARTCAEIATRPGKLDKVRCLATYLATLAEADLATVAVWFTGTPFATPDGRVLQFGWAQLRMAICQVAGVSEESFRAVYLKHSDTGEAVIELFHGRTPGRNPLTIANVAQTFRQMASARGPTAKLPLVKTTLERATALEAKFLVKIISGDLRIGLKEGLVEEAIATAFETSVDQVRRANLLLGHTGEVAVLAGRRALGEAGLRVFRPVKFMLASPEPTAEAVWARMSAGMGGEGGTVGIFGAVWLEDKYDGIRCQLHKSGSRVALYSRDGKDLTSTFADLSLAAQRLGADMVLDGEIVAMRGDAALPFAELQKRLGRREADLFLGDEIPIRLIVFDLLWQDGETLLDDPLHERRRRLEALALEPPFGLARITEATSPDEIEVAFAAARARGNEGLMVKDPASTYTPGRRGLAWLKLKKALATLDCVVVGAEYGHGKRRAVLSDYTFAVRDERDGTLKVIGKAYSGLTDEEIAQLTEHFLTRVVRQRGRYHEVEPDTVLEIAFDRIQASDRHDSGLALRFPRIARIRPDKTAAEIDTLARARRLVGSNRDVDTID